MIYHLKLWYTWLRRCKSSRGFGVQSPSAYSFIRYVVNEHYPYYAYKDLAHRCRDLKSLEHKFGRLLLRIANYWQPDMVYSDGNKYHPYISAGCKKSLYAAVSSFLSSADNDVQGTAKLVVLDWTSGMDEKQLLQVLQHCDAKTMLVILGIHRNKACKQTWQQVVQSESTCRTFGLYYAGIAFFDRMLHKQHYEVNF